MLRFTLGNLLTGIGFIALICAAVANREPFFAFMFALLAIVCGVALLDRHLN